MHASDAKLRYVTHLDRRQVIEEKDPRHVLPLLYLSPFEVLRDRVLIAVDSVVAHILVYCGHHLQGKQAPKLTTLWLSNLQKYNRLHTV